MGNTERTSITRMEVVVKNKYVAFMRKPLTGFKLTLKSLN